MIKGFKGFDIVPGSAPKLSSPSWSYNWKPGENVSSKPTEDFAGAMEGFYALKSPKELVEHGYYPREGGIAGEIVQYGKVAHGPMGQRSTKAQISMIFEEDTCDLCDEAPAAFLLKPDHTYLAVCKKCYEKIRKALPESKHLETTEREEVYTKLQKYYDVPIASPPEEFRLARKKARR